MLFSSFLILLSFYTYGRNECKYDSKNEEACMESYIFLYTDVSI